MLGLLPVIALDLSISLAKAGFIITGYALSVALGAPLMGVVTNRLERKSSLLLLLFLFIVGNILCALAHSYDLLLLARLVTALCHAAFFGIGALEAASLVSERQKASAVAFMFGGLTLANIIGVPAGTALGQATSWQLPFFAVAAIGAFALVSMALALPSVESERPASTSVWRELRALKDPSVFLALATTVASSTSLFLVFAYVVPILEQVAHMPRAHASYILLLIGIGLTIGNIIGGKLADISRRGALLGMFLCATLLHIVLFWTLQNQLTASLSLFLWGAVSFAVAPSLQANAIDAGKQAPNFISTFNIGAFNLGNAAGAFLGSILLTLRIPLGDFPLVAAVISFLAFLMALTVKNPNFDQSSSAEGIKA